MKIHGDVLWSHLLPGDMILWSESCDLVLGVELINNSDFCDLWLMTLWEPSDIAFSEGTRRIKRRTDIVIAGDVIRWPTK